MIEPAAHTENNRKPGAPTEPEPIAVDDAHAEPLYANFCRVVGLPDAMALTLAVAGSR